MYSVPVTFINRCFDGFFMVLFETYFSRVLLGLLFAAVMIAFLVKIFR